jgi:tetratricopeptide (TPR) repeat protein
MSFPDLTTRPSAVPPRRDFSRVRALVIDENNAARKVMRDLLSGMGIGQVLQSTDPVRAIRQIEQERFGLVLCEWRFHSPVNGGQVLEYLRTRRLLAPGAAFVLVSSEASRPMLAAAQEWSPDGFILKPLTPAALTPRIEGALRRRAEFAGIHEAADRGDWSAVLVRLEKVVAHAGGPTIETLRWQVQALLELARHDEAVAACRQALAMKDGLPWAELGLARVDRAAGRIDGAFERARAITRTNPYFGGAYDLMIAIHQERGEAAEATAVAQAALKQLATAQRARTLGEVAYAAGELELAEQTYADLVRRNSASPTRSGLDVGMLGQVLVAQGEAGKALQLLNDAQGELAGDVQSQAVAASVAAQAHVARGDAEAAEASARRAIELAGTQPAVDEKVALLVAQGAFRAGLRGEGEALVAQAVKNPAAPTPFALKVMGDVGIAPAVLDPKANAERARTVAATDTPVADDIQQALAHLHAARFDDAVRCADTAREKLPGNPMVLVTTVQAHLLRMRARGYDLDSARLVRKCLVEIDRQIPGDDRVFPFK